MSHFVLPPMCRTAGCALRADAHGWCWNHVPREVLVVMAQALPYFTGTSSPGLSGMHSTIIRAVVTHMAGKELPAGWESHVDREFARRAHSIADHVYNAIMQSCPVTQYRERVRQAVEQRGE